MKTMRGVAVFGPNDVKVVDDIPIPSFGDYEALVKVHACGLCTGTDFRIIGGQLTKEEDRFAGYPTILGHEGCGEVIAVGKKVKNYKIGDRFIHPNLRANVGNGYTKTFGGMAQYGIVNDNEAMLDDGLTKDDFPFPLQGKIPSDFDYIDGGVLLSMCESHSAALNLKVQPGQDALIYGAGPMGQMLAKFMKILGVNSITMVDHHDSRLQHAMEVAGVDYGINSSKQVLNKVLGNKKFDIAVDAVGSTSIILEASKMLRAGGVIGAIGVLKLDDRKINIRELQNGTSLLMLNFPVGEYAIMPKTVEMIRKGVINPKDYYSHVLPYTEINEAMRLVRSREAFKVILTID